MAPLLTYIKGLYGTLSDPRTLSDPGSLNDPETLQNCPYVIPAKHGLFLLNYADSESEVCERVTAYLYFLCGILLEKTKQIEIPGYK